MATSKNTSTSTPTATATQAAKNNGAKPLPPLYTPSFTFRLSQSAQLRTARCDTAIVLTTQAGLKDPEFQPLLAEYPAELFPSGGGAAHVVLAGTAAKAAGFAARRVVVQAVKADKNTTDTASLRERVGDAVRSALALAKTFESGSVVVGASMADLSAHTGAAGDKTAAEAHNAWLIHAVAAAGQALYVYGSTKNMADAKGKSGAAQAKNTAPKYSGIQSLSFAANVPAGKAGATTQAAFDRAYALAQGVMLAQELGNRPPNYATPTALGQAAQAIAKAGGKGFSVKVHGPADVARLGMGSFISVANGTTEPLRFIELHYLGAGKLGAGKAAPKVLVGKGVTFDTGGISLKPGPEMDEMKYDMCGAASVLGVFQALAALPAAARPKINLIGLIPATENMPAGNATRPGDVVTSMSGQTIEILNTDAEGRLILCDALTYAERFKPAAVVDIATLTGACVIALGGVRSGLFSSDDTLAAALSDAGEQAGDGCWRMPLDDDYAAGLKSNFADLANVAGRAAGSVTAAKFLQRFAGAYPWAHLDIAGTAWKSGASKGATGRPVPLLWQYILSQAN